MPGFLKTKDISSNFILSNGTEVYSEKFYGFEYDPATGGLSINEVDDKSEVIRLPEVEGSYDEKYIYWIWSGSEVEFSWDSEYGSRLIMEVS